MHDLLPRALMVLAGLVVCFRGYSTFRVALGLTAFFVGAHAVLVRESLLPREPSWLVPAVVILAGLLAAVVILTAYRLGVLLLGAAALVLCALGFPSALPQDPMTRIAVLAAVALLGAILARFVERVLLSVATALYGAFMVASTLFAPGTGRFPSIEGVRETPHTSWLLAFWLALAAFGVFAQLGSRRPRRPVEKTERG